jgi:hypothetical protein
MYGTLTFRELTTLQSMLYEGTEQAYCLANLDGSWHSDPGWFGRYQPTHREIAELFIEAAAELLERIDEQYVQAA